MNHQLSFLDGVRDGITFEPDRDLSRLNRQMRAVWEVMRDGRPHTPEELERRTGYSWASISARCRDFRKPRFGGFEVRRTSLGGGLFEYQLVRRPQ